MKMQLDYFIRKREQTEVELPEVRRMAEQGMVGGGAVNQCVEVIGACKLVELEILSTLGNPC